MASSSNFRSVFLPSKSRLLAFVSVPSAFRRLFPRFSEPLFPIMYGLSKQRRRSDKSKIRHEFGDAREQCALVFFWTVQEGQLGGGHFQRMPGLVGGRAGPSKTESKVSSLIFGCPGQRLSRLHQPASCWKKERRRSSMAGLAETTLDKIGLSWSLVL